MPASTQNFEGHLLELLRKGNLAYAEILLRILQQDEPDNPKIYYYLGEIASFCQLPAFAREYFTKAAKLSPGWQAPVSRLAEEMLRLRSEQAASKLEIVDSNPLEQEKFLLIKSWGCGFWSDVSHVLGQLLLAEMTGRIPVVDWGENSWFNDGTAKNAFAFYFEKVSAYTLADLQKKAFDVWPPKWDRFNLSRGEVNKMAGPYSRIAGLYLLGRNEKVIVSDFYTSMRALLPWIPRNHPLFGHSIDQVYRYLTQRYLHPTREILAEVDAFHASHLASQDYLAVHVRGSDKVAEVSFLDELNRSYQPIIDEYLTKYACQRIFLMTDDVNILDGFSKLYPGMIVTTDSLRTDDQQGIHFKSELKDRRRIGTEVMVDVYLAAKAKAFIGNGLSNTSAIIPYVSESLQENYHLICQNILHFFYASLYE